VPIGLALTTTALGTLLPILRDNDMLGGPFGQYVYAAGAAGELFPILIIAVFLTGRGNFIARACPTPRARPLPGSSGLGAADPLNLI
jgi:Kef-type K+ transport system membrane component KefB